LLKKVTRLLDTRTTSPFKLEPFEDSIFLGNKLPGVPDRIGVVKRDGVCETELLCLLVGLVFADIGCEWSSSFFLARIDALATIGSR